MAQGDLAVFDEAFAYMLDGGWESADTIKLALITSGLVPVSTLAEPGMNAGATNTFTEVAAGGVYTAGGETLDTYGAMVVEASRTMTFDDTGSSVVWLKQSASPTNCRYAIGYNSSDTGVERAIFWIDLGGTVDLVASDLTITWHASGIFTIT